MKRLGSLLRRMLNCSRNEHLDTIDFSGGSVWRVRCVDCGRAEMKGWVLPGVSNKSPHPWELDDA